MLYLKTGKGGAVEIMRICQRKTIFIIIQELKSDNNSRNNLYGNVQDNCVMR